MKTTRSMRQYIFTKDGERLKFPSATAAREYFDKYHYNFPSCYVGKTWKGWKVAAEPYIWRKGKP